jgi:adenosylmethionine-8-amino-7-oxononanoate aminotransferase
MKSIADLDREVLWHPFTQMQEWCAGEPLVIERAEGNYLIDVDGKRYLDGVSSLWVTVHGHNRAELNQAITNQLDRVAHSTMLGLTNVPAVQLAKRLVDLAPGALSRVFYSDSGSTSVEIALKQAFQYWQLKGRATKTRFAHLAEAYHGDTLGAVGVGGIGVFHQIFAPLLVDSFSVPTPHAFRSGKSPEAVRDQALAALEGLLVERSEEIAALIIEPLVQGAAGMLMQPAGYLRGVADLCLEHDVLLIADEVATGFGRTGTMFACEQEGVEPDLLCLAKGITGGYLPLAATLATEEIYGAFLGARSDLKAFFHGHTYTGNPVACAAALASLELFAQDRVLEELPGKVELLSSLMDERLGDIPWVGDIRQRGLMVGVELVADADSQAAFPPERAVGAAVCEAVRAHGVILRPLGDVVVLMPPLSSSREDLELLVDATAKAIRAVCD